MSTALHAEPGARPSLRQRIHMAALAQRLARWRAFLSLLAQAGRARVAAFAALVLAVGLLPIAVILLTGRMVAALPAAVAAGPAGERAVVLSLALLVGCLAALSLASAALGQLARVLNNEFALAVHQAVARVTL